jgi:hypothetical protein
MTESSNATPADIAALLPNDTALLMEPYFQCLGSNPSNIAPERKDELMAEVFGGRLWDLFAVKGAPPGGVQPFLADPATRSITVSYSGLAMVWCIARYPACLASTALYITGCRRALKW